VLTHTKVLSLCVSHTRVFRLCSNGGERRAGAEQGEGRGRLAGITYLHGAREWPLQVRGDWPRNACQRQRVLFSLQTMPFGPHRLRFVPSQTPSQHVQARPSLPVPKISFFLSIIAIQGLFLFFCILYCKIIVLGSPSCYMVCVGYGWFGFLSTQVVN
jgi:hypothetical protein